MVVLTRVVAWRCWEASDFEYTLQVSLKGFAEELDTGVVEDVKGNFSLTIDTE